MYDVNWVESAVLMLADSWTRADRPRREAITAAAHRIDTTLTLTPLDAGESRDDDQRRILIDLPLVVVFEVDVVHETVTVLHAFAPEKRGPER